MAANGYDRRYSSIARDVDAAIERVVTHFEDSDLALRLDVLRSLTVHAKLAFETERIKQRLQQHPVPKDLIECVTTQSKGYERLYKSLAVEEYSCEYDRARNVEMQATVKWELPESKKSKRRGRASDGKPLWTKYTFSRDTDAESGETVVIYTLSVGLGIDAEVKQLVRYELCSDSPYPRSFYEEDEEMDDGEHDGDEEEKSDAEEEEEDAQSDEEKCEAMDEDNEEKDPFGEQIRGFDFDDAVLDTILEWMGAEEEELDPSDVISFFLALPIYEDDWTIDERVCSILFNAGGGSEMMEEEIVSDFDDEDNEGNEDGGDSEQDDDIEVADLD